MGTVASMPMIPNYMSSTTTTTTPSVPYYGTTGAYNANTGNSPTQSPYDPGASYVYVHSPSQSIHPSSDARSIPAPMQTSGSRNERHSQSSRTTQPRIMQRSMSMSNPRTQQRGSGQWIGNNHVSQLFVHTNQSGRVPSVAERSPERDWVVVDDIGTGTSATHTGGTTSHSVSNTTVSAQSSREYRRSQSDSATSRGSRNRGRGR